MRELRKLNQVWVEIVLRPSVVDFSGPPLVPLGTLLVCATTCAMMARRKIVTNRWGVAVVERNKFSILQVLPFRIPHSATKSWGREQQHAGDAKGPCCAKAPHHILFVLRPFCLCVMS